jgi:release factor glutamine methyltransferase
MNNRQPLRLAILEAERILTDAGVASPRVDAELLAAHVLGVERTRLPLVPLVDPPVVDAIGRLVAERARRVPLQHLTGWVAIGGITLVVGPGVFVPRPETELVAYRAARHLRAVAGPATAVDLCTGSGAIACFLREAVPGARLLATEVDRAALAWARRNLGDRDVELLEGDLDEPLPEELHGRIDVLVANVPYVPSGQIPLLPHDVRVHEPLVALDGGAEGLDVFARVVERAGRWLAPGGWLICEIGDDQDDAATALLEKAGFEEIAVMPDLTGRIRMVEGRWPR